jgi:hypothetical protein
MAKRRGLLLVKLFEPLSAPIDLVVRESQALPNLGVVAALREKIGYLAQAFGQASDRAPSVKPVLNLGLTEVGLSAKGSDGITYRTFHDGILSGHSKARVKAHGATKDCRAA